MNSSLKMQLAAGILFAASCQLSAAPSLFVGLYNDSSASERDLKEMKQDASRVLKRAGIEIEWIPCVPGPQEWAADQQSPDAPVGDTWISVMVRNSAAVPDQTLSEALNEAGKILGKVGVEVEWIDCHRPMNNAACSRVAEGDRFLLTIVSEDNRSLFGEDVLGRSVPGSADAPGVYARAFYRHVREKADKEGVSPGALLGLVVAHEFGHLLLGPGAHSARGIMQANWSHRDMQRGIQGQLRFTAEQAPLIQANVQSRMKVSDSSPHQHPPAPRRGRILRQFKLRTEANLTKLICPPMRARPTPLVEVLDNHQIAAGLESRV